MNVKRVLYDRVWIAPDGELRSLDSPETRATNPLNLLTAGWVYIRCYRGWGFRVVVDRERPEARRHITAFFREYREKVEMTTNRLLPFADVRVLILTGTLERIYNLFQVVDGALLVETFHSGTEVSYLQVYVKHNVG